MAEAYFWRAKDVAEVLQCSVSKAHKLMAAWNKELEARGYVTMQGRVPRRYAIDRLGIEARADGEERTNHKIVTDVTSRRAGAVRRAGNRRLPA